MSAKNQSAEIDTIYPTLLKATPVDIRNKSEAIREFCAYMLIRTQSMLTFSGLPDSMPEREIVRTLQTHGYMVIPDPAKYKELDGKYYGLWGGLGGEYTPYYTPSWCTISNPYIKPRFSATITIWDPDPEKVTGLIVRHDPYYMGILPLIRRYATMLAEVDISLLLAFIHSRTPIAITAPDDRAKESADLFYRRLEEGRVETIASDDFISAIKAIPITAAGYNVITQLIEAKQYLRAGLFNDLGLSANYNMKREAINSIEAQLDNDALRPLIDEIIDTIRADLEIVNSRYGLNIGVDLGSAWEQRAEINEAEIAAAENEAAAGPAEEPTENTEKTEKEENEKSQKEGESE